MISTLPPTFPAVYSVPFILLYPLPFFFHPPSTLPLLPSETMANIQTDAHFDISLVSSSHSVLSASQHYSRFCSSLRSSPPSNPVDGQPPRKKLKRSHNHVCDVSEDDHVIIASVELRIVRSPLGLSHPFANP